MTRFLVLTIGALAASCLQAQPQRPMFETSKVEGNCGYWGRGF